ncbi:MAG: MBOAT family protein [Erysipelotrichaceae bacterium]|nr:MBOAT family protein [Erysipelotrichaceae bacterium]
MLFSSLVFLFVFFPLVIITYYIFKSRFYRNLVLLVFSFIFYAWGEPIYVLLMIAEICVNYILAKLIAKNEKASIKKMYFVLAIIIDLGLLGFYKYANFLIDIVNSVLSLNINFLELSLPIGISFYTFQILSYIIDVYRNKVKVQNNVLYLATYVTMFPQLIAGPIVRYETIEHELTERKESVQMVGDGMRRFIIGLGKKIIIANNMAIIADKVFLNTPLGEYSFFVAWIGAISYSLQIYFDFSGYSDMAIGIGKIFGFNFLENFNYPYIAKSITDFWRRWHISLSSWFRDYVYIPLGGNRVSKSRWFLNIMIVWLLTGLWHGASYNFVVWGLYYGLFLIIEKLFLLKILEKAKGINHLFTLIVVIFGFVIFNSASLDQIVTFFSNMFMSLPNFDMTFLKTNGLVYLIPYFMIACISATPLFTNIGKALKDKVVLGYSFDLYLLIVFIICIIFLVNSSYNPFIYYRF